MDNGEVIATLVMEEWYKGTPLDATTTKDTLYNNKDDNNEVKGLVVSLTSRELTCMSFFFRFLRG